MWTNTQDQQSNLAPTLNAPRLNTLTRRELTLSEEVKKCHFHLKFFQFCLKLFSVLFYFFLIYAAICPITCWLGKKEKKKKSSLTFYFVHLYTFPKNFYVDSVTTKENRKDMPK